MQNISYVIPTYNYEKYITDSILSIVHGNLKMGDEIVVVNDGSTDGTAELLQRLQKKYSSIRVINQKKNSGGAAARNTAVSNARHDLIFCLDSDNLLMPGSVQKLLAFMNSQEADAAAFECVYYFNKSPNRVTHVWKFQSEKHTFADCLAGSISPIASGNYLYTKNSWERSGGYPEFAQALDAWGFGLRQLATGTKMVVMPKSYYLHRYGHESYWIRESEQNNEMAFKILEPYLDQIADEDIAYLINNSCSWFSKFTKKPIKIKNDSLGRTGKVLRRNSFSVLLRNMKHCVKMNQKK